MNQKFAINEQVSSLGIVAEGDILRDDKIKFVFENPGTVEVYVKINGQTGWDLLDTISSNLIINVTMYDQIRIVALSSDFKLIAVGFDDVQ